MRYIIVGLREDGDLALYDRAMNPPTLGEAERICDSFGYKQLLVVEAGQTGAYAQRYEFDNVPRIREVPLTSAR